MKIALDANRYVDFARGDAVVREALENADEVYIPLIVVGELRAGFALGSRTAANEGGLRSRQWSSSTALYSTRATYISIVCHNSRAYEQLNWRLERCGSECGVRALNSTAIPYRASIYHGDYYR